MNPQTASSRRGKVAPIVEAPLALSPIAEKVNELIALVASGGVAGSLTAQTPLKLTVADSGPAVLGLDVGKLASLLRSDPNGTASGGSSGTTSTAASALPYEDATILITLDANGIKLLNKSTGYYAKFYTTGAIGIVVGTNEIVLNSTGLSLSTSGNSQVDITYATGLVVTGSGGATLTIGFSAITRNMSIRTLTVCDGGLSKSIDVIASAAY